MTNQFKQTPLYLRSGIAINVIGTQVEVDAILDSTSNDRPQPKVLFEAVNFQGTTSPVLVSPAAVDMIGVEVDFAGPLSVPVAPQGLRVEL